MLPLALASGIAALLIGAPTLLARRRIRRLERRLADTRAEADRADAARRRLLASLNHDLRGPLGAIIGYQELLADGIYGELDGQAHDALGRIGAAARELLSLIDAVVDVSRLEAGEARLRIEPVDPAAILAEAIAHAHASAGSGTARLDLRDGHAPPTLATDPDRLRRLLELALGAALAATPDRRIEVRWHAADRDTLSLVVPGTGLAAPDPSAPGADDEPARPGPHGLRLGLAVRLVRLLGGRLTLEPDAGAATLQIRIPSTAQPH